jgi:nitronate monooxygenase
VVHRSNRRRDVDLQCLIGHRVELVITSVGSPEPVIDPLHEVGCRVFAGVSSLAHAMRARYDGPIVLAGGISDGQSMLAAQVLGADFAYLGTKYYISAVDEAGALIIVARTDPERLSLFLVPTDATGLIKHRLPVGISLPYKHWPKQWTSATGLRRTASRSAWALK